MKSCESRQQARETGTISHLDEIQGVGATFVLGDEGFAFFAQVLADTTRCGAQAVDHST